MSQKDFSSYQASLSGPASYAEPVAFDGSPADVEFDHPCRSLYVGGTGDLVITPADGDSPVTFSDVPAGWFPVRCKAVHAESTASDIVAVW